MRNSDEITLFRWSHSAMEFQSMVGWNIWIESTHHLRVITIRWVYFHLSLSFDRKARKEEVMESC